jgi:hypothetical protein
MTFAGAQITTDGKGEPDLREDLSELRRTRRERCLADTDAQAGAYCSKLDDNKIALSGSNGTVIHSAHDFGFFANASIGYAFDL